MIFIVHTYIVSGWPRCDEPSISKDFGINAWDSKWNFARSVIHFPIWNINGYLSDTHCNQGLQQSIRLIKHNDKVQGFFSVSQAQSLFCVCLIICSKLIFVWICD